MAYRDIQHFISVLEKDAELVRIKKAVSPELEMAEIADRLVNSGGKAVLFENTGTEFPVLMNAMGTEHRMCKALGVEKLDYIGKEIEDLFKTITTQRSGFFDKLRLLPSLKKVSSWFPSHSSSKGACQEVIMESADLKKLPVLKCWPYDGGPFITLPVVHTCDPISGNRNVGMYRMQVFDGQTTGMHWHLHKNSANHYQEWKKTGKKMPVSVTLGGDPAYTYVATAPLPANIDEYLLAGFLRKKKVELVKCLTNNLEVPSDVDFVIEGYVDPLESLVVEGPFGDHTGFYSLPDLYPVFHITCITHRKHAVYPATLVGIPPKEDLFIGKATERIFLQPIRMTMLPEIIDMHMPAEGVFHNIVFVKINPAFPGHAARVINALWGAGQMMFNKILIVVSEEIDLTNYLEVFKTVCSRLRIPEDIITGRGPLDVLDHSSAEFACGGKLGFDATNKNLSQNTVEQYVKIISIKKNQIGQVRETANAIIREDSLKSVKFLVFVEDFVESEDYFSVVWRVANNIDTARDCYVISASGHNILVIDGTRKYRDLDGFDRPWPNCTVMDDETIGRIDEMWPLLGLGSLVASPSARFRKHLYPGGAEAT